MGNKKSFHYHMSNKRINNENTHQLLNSSGDLLAVDADMALDFTSNILWSFVHAPLFKEEINYESWERIKPEIS